MHPKLWLRKHRLIAFMLGTLGFLLLTVPTAWSGFCSEPFYPWLFRHFGSGRFVSSLSWILPWILPSLGGILLVSIVWALFGRSIAKFVHVYKRMSLIIFVIVFAAIGAVFWYAVYKLPRKQAGSGVTRATQSATAAHAPSSNVNLDDLGARSGATTTHTFWLLRKEGSTISLDCPSERCMQFQLGKLKQEDGRLVQEIILTGAGFTRHPPRPGFLVDFDNPIHLKGDASLEIPFGNSPWIVAVGLKEGTKFQMFGKYADFDLSILDLKADSLRIQLTVAPPSGFKLGKGDPVTSDPPPSTAGADGVTLDKQAARWNQRAWVSISDMSGSPEVGKPFMVRTTMKNTGKSVARKINVVSVNKGVSKGEIPDFDAEEQKAERKTAIGTGMTLLPNRQISGSISVRGGEILDKPTVDAINSGRMHVFIFGKIIYFDIFECPCWSTFCFFFQSESKEWGIFREYNDTDNNQCP